MSTNTKIIRLQAENFKRIKAIDISPTGATQVIGGKNAQGKTSVLDAIMAAIGGGRACPPDPIRHGQKRASIKVELGDLTITRKFGRGGTTVEVISREKGKLKSPQAVLDALTGSLSFDPLAFCNKKPDEQAEMLREMAGLDLTDLDSEIGRLTEVRKACNATVKRLKGAAESATMHKGMPADPVVISELLSEHKRRREHNNARQALASKSFEANRDADIIADRIDKAKQNLRDMEAEREGYLAAHENAEKAWDAMHEEDTDEVQAQIESAEETNAKVRDNIAAFRARKAHEEADKEAESATEKLKDAREARADAIAAATFPVEGLTVGEDGVEFNGVVFEQASGAEKIRVSAAIGLAMNPELKVLLIRDGSLMDDEAMAALHAVAQEADAQIWIERVGDGDECGIVIEDGEIA